MLNNLVQIHLKLLQETQSKKLQNQFVKLLIKSPKVSKTPPYNNSETITNKEEMFRGRYIPPEKRK